MIAQLLKCVRKRPQNLKVKPELNERAVLEVYLQFIAHNHDIRS